MNHHFLVHRDCGDLMFVATLLYREVYKKPASDEWVVQCFNTLKAAIRYGGEHPFPFSVRVIDGKWLIGD